MKYIYSSIFLLILAVSSVMVDADNDIDYLSEIAICNREVSRKSREVELKMVVDLSQLKIRSQHTVALTPVLVFEDGNREVAFPPIVIDAYDDRDACERRMKNRCLPKHTSGCSTKCTIH